jgi:hypothetical protein
MRCLACDCVLTDFEATRKAKDSGQYVDLCDRCFETIRGEFAVIEREDLKPTVDDGWADDGRIEDDED